MKLEQEVQRRPSLREIIRQQVENDPITIRDKRVMREKWGVEVRPVKRGRKKV